MAKKKARYIVRYAVIAIILVVVLVANYLAISYSSIISLFLNQETFRVDTTNMDSSLDTQYFKSDYTKLTALDADETAYAKDVQTEGSVLLQNKEVDGVPILPLPANAAVTLLGTGSTSDGFLLGGGGSGAIDTSDTPNLREAFEAAQYTVNGIAWDFYNTGAGSAYRANVAMMTVGEAPVSEVESIRNSFSSYNDAAIIVISRPGNEGNDLPTTTTEDSSKHYLELSKNELDLINLAVQNFDRVVILLNTVNPIELGPVEDLDVSVLWVGAGGEIGIAAIPEILNGTRVPSGKTVDTYAYDALSAPAMQNFGAFAYTNLDEAAYLNYAESIYVGYKYYETRYADVVTGRQNVGNFDYASEVQFPFGFGLSYTTFAYSNFSLQDNGDTITLSVDVTNTGNVDAKEAVEFYMQAPYTDYDIQNGIEKSAIQLVDFTKTEVIPAGGTATATVTFSKEVMRVYDTAVEQTYIVEVGDYYFTAAADAHKALNNVLAAAGYTIANGMTDDGDSNLVGTVTQSSTDTETYAYGVDGLRIINQFANVNLNYYMPTTYLTRNDWVGTFPTTLGGEARSIEAPDNLIADMKLVHAEDPSAVVPTTGASFQVDLATLTLLGLEEDNYNNETWELLLDQLTAREMMNLVALGGYQTVAVESIGKKQTLDKDGPAGISSTLIGGAGCFGYPVEMLLSSTWNKDLADRFGYFVGEDALYSGVSGWYAPAMNIHRTPFAGRNFEYFSEDSAQSGIFGAIITKAAQEKGLYCYIKHYALNDQETNRAIANTFATEQAIREIYLLPFEMSIREGGAHALMVSQNLIGAKWTGAHKGLMTNVLRNEWGFQGVAITDYAGRYTEKLDTWDGLAAGTDMWLCSAAGSFDIDGFENNATVMNLLRTASKHILYAVANSNSMNGVAPGAVVISVTPPWQIALYVVDCVIGLLLVVAFVLTTRSLIKVGNAGDVVEDVEIITKSNPLYDKLAAVFAAVSVIGAVVEAIGGAVLSKPTGIGMNTNLSPVLYVGMTLIAVGFIASVVVKQLTAKAKCKQTWQKIAMWIGVLAVIFAIVFLALTILMPVIAPTNG